MPPVRIAILILAILLPAGINLIQYWLHNPLYGHGLWVPVLAAYLSWRRGWGADSARTVFPKAAAVIIAAYFASLPVLRIVQVANPDWRLIDWLLACAAVAALLALAAGLGGRKLLARQWFPACFLLAAVPWPTSIEHGFTEYAVRFSATAAQELLWLVKVPAVASGRTIWTTVGPIGLSDDCSGIRSVQLTLMASLFWAGFFGLRNWRAVAMLCAGEAAALVLNIVRVSALVFAAALSGRPGVVEEWHDFAGQAAQVSLMALLPAIGLLCRGKWRPSSMREDTLFPCSPVSTRTVLALAVWLLAVETVAEGWFRLGESPATGSDVAWTLRKAQSIPGIATKPMPDAVNSNYNYSRGERLGWEDAQAAKWEVVWLGFDKGAISACLHNIHRPEVCLSGADYALAARFPDLDLLIDGRKVVFQHQMFRRGEGLLHLFNALLIEGNASGSQCTDWTWSGRLRAAWLGLRGQRASLVHLIVEHPYQAGVARGLAVQNLKLLMRRAPVE
jgi:exosortase